MAERKREKANELDGANRFGSPHLAFHPAPQTDRTVTIE